MNARYLSRKTQLLKFVPQSRIQAVLSAHPDEPVKVYTYQSAASMASMNKRGYLGGNTREGISDDYFVPAYDWMREQMQKRLPDYTGEYPIWGWLKRPSTKYKDSRYAGTKGHARITAMVPRKRILLSDYELWHSVLNNDSCCLTEKEYDSFRGDLRKSWELIFDFTPYTDKDITHWIGARHRIITQVCIDRIYETEITSIKGA